MRTLSNPSIQSPEVLFLNSLTLEKGITLKRTIRKPIKVRPDILTAVTSQPVGTRFGSFVREQRSRTKKSEQRELGKFIWKKRIQRRIEKLKDNNPTLGSFYTGVGRNNTAYSRDHIILSGYISSLDSIPNL